MGKIELTAKLGHRKQKDLGKLIEADSERPICDIRIGGLTPKLIDIYISNAINNFPRDPIRKNSFSKLQNLLLDAGFSQDKVDKLNTLLLYYKYKGEYVGGIWEPTNKKGWSMISPTRKKALEDLKGLTKTFLYETKNHNSILTYPYAYQDVREICQKIVEGMKIGEYKIPYRIEKITPKP